MTRVLIAAALVVVALVVAQILNRRRRSAAPTQARWAVPEQLDRADFARAGAPWLVVVFSSATCDSCAQVVSAAGALEAGDVAVDVVPVQQRAALHQRYHVDAVPMTLIADDAGVVRASLVGPAEHPGALADALRAAGRPDRS